MANIIELHKRKTALMLRVGGLGDCLILTPIAKQLHKKGYAVDYFCGSPTGDMEEMFKGLPYINDCKTIGRVNNIDCIQDADKNIISVDIIKEKYDEVFDFKLSIEDNRSGFNKVEGWRQTLNSNYFNWIDLSLAWVNIDPTTVPSDEKSPEIVLDEKYINWANELFPETERIAIQLQASTLVRSWYKAADLPNLIYKNHPNSIILVFSSGWTALTQYGNKKIEIPEGFNPICCSAALIKSSKCFIAADSGMSHVAEAVGTPTIGIYTTVPSWTRVRDYKHAHPIDAVAECRPCFSLHIFCPLRMKEAENNMSDREKELVKMVESGTNPIEICRHFNTVPKAIEMEYRSAKQRQDALSAGEPQCVRSVLPEMIIAKLDEVLNANSI